MNQQPGAGNSNGASENGPPDDGRRSRDFPPDHAAAALRALGAASRVQTLVAIGLALGLLLVGPLEAWSSMLGSLAVYLPGVVFTAVVARKIGSDSAGFLRTAALAEFGKLFLTGLLCALTFIWVKPLAPGWFFAGMLAVLATGWIGFAKALR